MQVGRIIGYGSYATVHSATEKLTGREVAVKQARPPSDFGLPLTVICSADYGDVLAGMRRDLLHAARLAPHPNIVAVFGSAECGRLIVMERAATDLAAIVAFCAPPRRRLPLALAAAWARDLLAAVDHLHAAGLAHMDIKSANVLLLADRTAKLCDFGLSKGFADGAGGDGAGEMSVDREAVTLWSRPPELLMGYQTHTAAVDEWGAGCAARARRPLCCCRTRRRGASHSPPRAEGAVRRLCGALKREGGRGSVGGAGAWCWREKGRSIDR